MRENGSNLGDRRGPRSRFVYFVYFVVKLYGMVVKRYLKYSIAVSLALWLIWCGYRYGVIWNDDVDLAESELWLNGRAAEQTDGTVT